jgi:hypothetical protein
MENKMKMNLKNAIVQLSNDLFDDINDWYNWRKINETLIPQEIKLPAGNQYKKNITLKVKLHDKWKSENDLSKKGDLIEYYIKTWGRYKGK